MTANDLDHIKKLAHKAAYVFHKTRSLTFEDYYSAGLEAYWKHRDEKFVWKDVYRAMMLEWQYWVTGRIGHHLGRGRFNYVGEFKDWHVNWHMASAEDICLNQERLNILQQQITSRQWENLINGDGFGLVMTRKFARKVLYNEGLGL